MRHAWLVLRVRRIAEGRRGELPGTGRSYRRRQALRATGVSVVVPPGIRPSVRRALLERGVFALFLEGRPALRCALRDVLARALDTPLVIDADVLVGCEVRLVPPRRRRWFEWPRTLVVDPVELVVVLSGESARLRDRYGRPTSALQITRSGGPSPWPA